MAWRITQLPDERMSWGSRGCRPLVSDFDLVVSKDGATQDGWATPSTETGSLVSLQTASSRCSIDLDMESTTDVTEYSERKYSARSSTFGEPKDSGMSAGIAEACRTMLQGVSSCDGSLTASIALGQPGNRLRVQQPQRGVKQYLGENTIEYRYHCLEQLGQLGRGTFGSVALVKCHVTGQTLALKSLSKGLLIEKQMQHKVKHEKLIMLHARSPFIIKLAACFNRNDHLHFLMEAATGGDLYAVYAAHGLFGSETHAQFYTACIAKALDHLHAQKIVYRDLKPENVVLDPHGYAKLCDLGMAKFLVLPDSAEGISQPSACRAHTICGTAEYMAPEMVGIQGYDYSVDWWSLGIVVHEMLVGKTPFVANSINDILSKARAGIEKVQLPMDAEWSVLVRGLCNRKPAERLPSLAGGIRNIEDLEWFRRAQFDWEAHGKCQLVAPFIPEGWKPPDWRSSLDIFGMQSPRNVPYDDPGTGWDRDFEDVVGPVCLDNNDEDVVNF